MAGRVALITGASSGIGYATAVELKARGFIVYGAARRLERMKSLEKLGITTIALDVTSEKSMVSCVENIAKQEGRIDVLVNSAGYGSFGAIEDVPMEEAKRQLEINVFGLARMTQLVIPLMRKHRYGKIVNISSMGGRIWVPFGGWYHATKFAVEGFSACLRLELKPFGIDVVVIEPGGVSSEWGSIAADHLEQVSEHGHYAAASKKTAAAMRKVYSMKLTRPETIAKCIAKAVMVKRPRTRYLLGAGAKPMVLMKNVLGDRLYDAILRAFM